MKTGKTMQSWVSVKCGPDGGKVSVVTVLILYSQVLKKPSQLPAAIECVHCHKIKNKIKNHAVDQEIVIL